MIDCLRRWYEHFQIQLQKHQIQSGRPVLHSARLPTLMGHKHSLDISCSGNFVKLTYLGLEKLKLLYTQNSPLGDSHSQEDAIQVWAKLLSRFCHTVTHLMELRNVSHCMHMLACVTLCRQCCLSALEHVCRSMRMEALRKEVILSAGRSVSC